MTVGFADIAKDFVDVDIDMSDDTTWLQAAPLVEWLNVASKISTVMGGVKYCTMSMAQITVNETVYHCDEFISSDDLVVSECSEVCRATMMPYQQRFNSRPARILHFLEFRLSKPSAECEAAITSIKFLMTTAYFEAVQYKAARAASRVHPSEEGQPGSNLTRMAMLPKARRQHRAETDEDTEKDT